MSDLSVPSPSPHPAPDFTLGVWRIQPSLNRMVQGDETVVLEPKVMAVLVHLAGHAGEVVTREALMAVVWADTYVVEENLTRCISTLRKHLGDDPQHPAFIETIRKVGYRLLVPVTPLITGDNLPTIAHPAPPPVAFSRPSRRWGWMVSGALVLALFVAGVYVQRSMNEGALQPRMAQPLSTWPGGDSTPALSPDGQLVAYAWVDPETNEADLYVKLVGTGTAQRLTSDPAWESSPAFSPDGHQIAYMYYAEGTCTLKLIPTLGGAARTLGACGANFKQDLDWSPDGRLLAYSDRIEGHPTLGLYTLDLETGERQQRTNPIELRYGDQDPTFSPDGRWLTFVRVENEEQADLYVLPLAGGTPRRLTYDARKLNGLAWLPDSRHLIVSSERSGQFTLWHVGLDGGALTWLGEGPGVISPAVARQQPRLVFMKEAVQLSLWRYALGDTAAPPTRFAPSTRLDGTPAYSPDGQQVAFASNRSGPFEIWLADAEGQQPQRLTDFQQGLVETPRWSPQGRYLAFNARPEGHADLYLLDTETGDAHRLTTDPADDWMPAWSPEGDWIYFGSTRSGTWQVWRLPSQGGSAEQVTQDGGWQPRPDAEGRYLYFARPGEAGIWRILMGGGEAERFYPDLHPSDWGNWLLDEGSLLALHRTPEGPLLMRIDLTTSQAQTEARLPHAPFLRYQSFTLAPDGRHLLYSRLEHYESDLWYLDLEAPLQNQADFPLGAER